MTGVDVLLTLFFGTLTAGSIYLARLVYDDCFAPFGLYLGVTFSTVGQLATNAENVSADSKDADDSHA